MSSSSLTPQRSQPPSVGESSTVTAPTLTCRRVTAPRAEWAAETTSDGCCSARSAAASPGAVPIQPYATSPTFHPFLRPGHYSLTGHLRSHQAGDVSVEGGVVERSERN